LMQLETELALVDPRERNTYYLDDTLTRRILTPVVRAVFAGMGKIEVDGVNNLPTTGPVILAANHLTNFDVFPMQFAIPRSIFFMGKAELFQNPLLDALLRRLGGFPVHRGNRDNWAMMHARRVLDAGQVLGMFPEGSRSKGRGLRPGKSGVARLAIETRCPVVPMGVDGSHQLFRHFPKRTAVKIRLGKPIWAKPHQSQLDLTDEIMFSLADLLPMDLRGVYAGKAKGF
jgi:1-acyl-sn-glycerol-3-phosphate acyltransferase